MQKPIDLHQGVRIGERLVPWGTTLAAAESLLGALPPPSSGPSIPSGDRWLPCNAAYGIPVVMVQLTGPAPDRPVMSVAFELAPDRAGPPDPERWALPLSQHLGTPDHVSREAPPSYAAPEDCVIYYGRWLPADVSVSLAVYGAERKVAGGLSAGCLSLSWSVRLAARPYVRDRLARCAALEAIAERLSDSLTVMLDQPQHPLYGPGSGEAAPDAMDSTREPRLSQLALYQPEILATPARLAPPHRDLRGVAFWVGAQDGVWGASTAWDTVMHEIGQPVAVRWIDLLPAKGGGYSGLEIGRWSVRAGGGSREIESAAGALAKLPGVTVDRLEGYDC